jgi:hypothetical protein
LVERAVIASYRLDVADTPFNCSVPEHDLVRSSCADRRRSPRPRMLGRVMILVLQ